MVPKGFRVADVTVGRVGGLCKVLLELVRAVDVVPVFDAVVEDVGRLVTPIADVGFEPAAVPGLPFAGDEWMFSLDGSGLDLPTSSLPESTDDSIGVAGGASSTSASEAI